MIGTAIAVYTALVIILMNNETKKYKKNLKPEKVRVKIDR